MCLRRFSLEFTEDGQNRPFFASFPFMAAGVPAAGIACGISSRFAGDMKYGGQNRARLALAGGLDLDPSRIYGLEQIHSRTVLVVDRDNPPAVPADGMVCRDMSIALSVTVADCLPVYLLDTESGAFGLVHSGWKGTGIALEALRLMRENWRTRPQAIAAVLGPCIDSCCYKVDSGRAAVFEKEFGAEGVRKTQDGDCYLDLKAANIRLLSGAGVRNIAVCNDCTFTDKRLGSFRREGGQSYTRMAALVYHDG
ncbi:MAG: polyphenol oxidase family protein [Treponema sp.]|jgi:YfiH family protein|nr:polyphenol oxidase family protein [Treponema sp.]